MCLQGLFRCFGDGEFGWSDGTLGLGLSRGRGVEGQSPSSAASPAAPPPLWLLSPWAVCPLPPMSGLLCSFCPLDLSGSPATSYQRLLCRAAPSSPLTSALAHLGGLHMLLLGRSPALSPLPTVLHPLLCKARKHGSCVILGKLTPLSEPVSSSLKLG